LAKRFKTELWTIEKNVIAASLPAVLRSVRSAGDVEVLVKTVNEARAKIAKRIDIIDKQLAVQAQQAAV
jgi:hypothetical protein